jgi:outer membrane lipoprotein-sorting protein
MTAATVMVCLPVISFAARADERGTAILRAAFQKMHNARTLSAEISTRVEMPGRAPSATQGKVLAMKPNYLRVEMKGRNAPLYVADGKNYYSYADGQPVYFKMPLDKNPTELNGQWEGEIDGFFGGAKNLSRLSATYIRSEVVAGIDCHLVKAEMKNPNRVVVYAVGKKDSLIHRAEMEMHLGESQVSKQTNRLTNIRLNIALTARNFAFNPPKTAKLYEPPNYEAKLVPVGQEAPNFTLPSPAGGQIALSEALRGKKALIVNFWFYG